MHYKRSIPLLAAIAHQGTTPHASGGASEFSLRQHSERHLTQYFERLLGMREEKERAGCIRPAAFTALLGYSGIGFSKSELAAIGRALQKEADGTHTHTHTHTPLRSVIAGC